MHKWLYNITEQTVYLHDQVFTLHTSIMEIELLVTKRV